MSIPVPPVYITPTTSTYVDPYQSPLSDVSLPPISEDSPALATTSDSSAPRVRKRKQVINEPFELHISTSTVVDQDRLVNYAQRISRDMGGIADEQVYTVPEFIGETRRYSTLVAVIHNPECRRSSYKYDLSEAEFFSKGLPGIIESLQRMVKKSSYKEIIWFLDEVDKTSIYVKVVILENGEEIPVTYRVYASTPQQCPLQKFRVSGEGLGLLLGDFMRPYGMSFDYQGLYKDIERAGNKTTLRFDKDISSIASVMTFLGGRAYPNGLNVRHNTIQYILSNSPYFCLDALHMLPDGSYIGPEHKLLNPNFVTAVSFTRDCLNAGRTFPQYPQKVTKKRVIEWIDPSRTISSMEEMFSREGISQRKTALLQGLIQNVLERNPGFGIAAPDLLQDFSNYIGPEGMNQVLLSANEKTMKDRLNRYLSEIHPEVKKFV